MLPHREQAASSSQNMSVLGRNGEFEKEDVIPGPIHSVFPETGYGSKAAAGRFERGPRPWPGLAQRQGTGGGTGGTKQPRSCMAKGPALLLQHTTASKGRGAAAHSR